MSHFTASETAERLIMKLYAAGLMDAAARLDDAYMAFEHERRIDLPVLRDEIARAERALAEADR